MSTVCDQFAVVDRAALLTELACRRGRFFRCPWFMCCAWFWFRFRLRMRFGLRFSNYGTFYSRFRPRLLFLNSLFDAGQPLAALFTRINRCFYNATFVREQIDEVG